MGWFRRVVCDQGRCHRRYIVETQARRAEVTTLGALMPKMERRHVDVDAHSTAIHGCKHLAHTQIPPASRRRLPMTRRLTIIQATNGQVDFVI